MHARMTRLKQVLIATFVACLGYPAIAHADNPSIDVVITDKGCEPVELTVAAGKTVFLIRNSSKRAIEWEILKDNLVVEERENIVPGFVQKLTATLDAGEYGMTCGLLSNPKGSLKVTARMGALEQPPQATSRTVIRVSAKDREG